MKTISGQIRHYRIEKGMTQEQLGASVGVSMQAVSKWERGGTPDIELLPAISDVLGVSIDELFGRTQKNPEEMIEEVVHATKPEKAFEYAYRLCWAAFLGLAHIDGNLEGNRTYNYQSEDADPEKDIFPSWCWTAGSRVRGWTPIFTRSF